MRAEFPGEGEGELFEGIEHPCALGCEEDQAENHPVSLGPDVDDPSELIL